MTAERFNLSAWSIKNPVPTLMLFGVMALVGLFSFFNLGIDANPNIDIPSVMITVTQPGAGPEELETQVTKKIEDAVAGLGNIDRLSSSVGDGVSTTAISFVLGTNSDRATNDVRNAIAQVRSSLPQDINEPIVQRLEFAGGAIMTYVLSSPDRTVADLSEWVDLTVSRALLSVPGVSQVKRLGGVEREIRVDLNPDSLAAYGLTATAVNDQIRAFNRNIPGGRAALGENEQNVRTLGSAATVDQLRAYPIQLGQGDTVPLGNLGLVNDGFGDPRQAAYLNGKGVVAFSVLRSTGSTLVTVEEGVRRAVAQLQTTLPKDLSLDLIFTRADSIRETYHDLIQDLVISTLLTVLVIGLCLWNWRATLITSVTLPLAIFPTFGVMAALGYTLNGMTLLALTLSLGSLVDDAVCMVENIDQHLQRGKSPLQAAEDAAREIGLAVFATSATVVAVFLPVAFMGGVPGQFFQPFGVTVAVATIFSTVVAVMLTPLVASRLMRWLPPKNLGKASRSPLSLYRQLLVWALRHRVTTLMVAVVFFVASLQLVPWIPKGFISSGDTGLSTLTLELPPGSPLGATTAIAQRVTEHLRAHPAVDRVLFHVGNENVNTALAYVKLLPREARRQSQRIFEQEMRSQWQEIPGAKIAFRASGGAGSTKDLAIVLKSENPQVLKETADRLEAAMAQLSGLVEVSSSLSLVKPEIRIVPDPLRASDLGVSVQSIARTASLALLGDSETNLAKFNLPDRQIPIRVKLNLGENTDLDRLRRLEVPGRNGQLVPLEAVADLRLGSGPALISRADRQREVEVSANLSGLSLGEALGQVRQLPILQNLPPEVKEEPAGDAKIMRDIFGRFGSALGLAILAIYGILVLLYGNFLYPLAILVALPLSIGGTLLALLLTGKELGLFALIGIVLLMGLVTKNAILLVDFALVRCQQGQTRFRAVVDSGLGRLRPIVMTSISTIAGMLPIALGLGANGQTRSPMAIAVVGGFTTSTLLTLVVVPVLFIYVDGWVQSLWPRSPIASSPTDFSLGESLGKGEKLSLD